MSWKCPFCDHYAVLTGANVSASTFEFNDNNKYGQQIFRARAVTCPNPRCKEYALSVELYDHDDSAVPISKRKPRLSWQLIPAASMENFPTYIPEAILADYREASLIADLSPKASATLARRCLQGMIRDFWGVQKNRLVDEIEAIRDKVNATTWDAIDAVRRIGNIGAHMEKDINTIVEVDPSEARVLLRLIETLIKDWYIERHERALRMKAIIELAASKKSGP